MTLDLDVRHRVGDLTIEIACAIGDGLTAIVGPSGAGKTTLLRLIAGVARPDAGVIRLGGHTLVDTGTRTWVPPHRRHVGYVSQEPRLFPHLSVRNNLRYARWCAGRRRVEGASLDDVVAMMELAALLSRSPRTLSGGEQQRVALARALLAAPDLLLLDEPLAAVDVARRHEILPYLDRLRADTRLPMIYVTHTIDEVERRAGQVVRMAGGRRLS